MDGATTNPVTQLASRVTGLQNGTTYWFAVSSVDTTGNVSAKSVADSATPGDQGEWASLAAGKRTHLRGQERRHVVVLGQQRVGPAGHRCRQRGRRGAPRPGRPDHDWDEVAVGSEFTCAIKASGTLWCFGGGARGSSAWVR